MSDCRSVQKGIDVLTPSVVRSEGRMLPQQTDCLAVTLGVLSRLAASSIIKRSMINSITKKLRSMKTCGLHSSKRWVLIAVLRLGSSKPRSP
jgi:hypothetical protein